MIHNGKQCVVELDHGSKITAPCPNIVERMGVGIYRS